MKLAAWAATAGISAAAGAVAVLMMPRNNATRKLAAKAAIANLSSDLFLLVTGRADLSEGIRYEMLGLLGFR